MTEQIANHALYETAAKHAAERAKWARVLAPVQPRKAQQKKRSWFWFFFK